MPQFKSARKRMQEAVEKALKQGNANLANEITANIMVGTTLSIMFLIMLICWGLNELGVFTVDKVIMRWSILLGFIVEAPITYLNFKYVGMRKWLKVSLMVDLILVCAIFAATLGHNVTLIMAFPIVVSTRYFDKKYTFTIAIFTALIFGFSSLANSLIGVINLNMLQIPEGTTVTVGGGENLRQALMELINNGSIAKWDIVRSMYLNEFLPRCFIFLALSSSCVFVASRGKKMVDTQSEITVKSSRIETELNLATKIQTSMLPCIFPAFPEHENIELYATYHPAKEVGGDFYDYFNIDKTHIGLVIADVSGKGVGAALFMTISKTIIKNQLLLGISPADALMNANKQLCESNDAGLFVTCWAGVYDVESGVLTFVNAGHNPPIILEKGENPRFIKQRKGFVLAGMDDFPYLNEELPLKVGDGMFFYTDGVTEATDANNQLFGNDRLIESLKKCKDKSPDVQLENVKKDIDEFVGEADQFDDITIMAMKINTIKNS